MSQCEEDINQVLSYGITKEESKKLCGLRHCQRMSHCAFGSKRDEGGAWRGLIHFTDKNLGFEGTDRICYIPLYNPNDFYGHRRYALYLFKMFLKCRAILCEADGKPDTEETQSNAERTPRKSKTELLKRNSMS